MEYILYKNEYGKYSSQRKLVVNEELVNKFNTQMVEKWGDDWEEIDIHLFLGAIVDRDGSDYIVDQVTDWVYCYMDSNCPLDPDAYFEELDSDFEAYKPDEDPYVEREES